MSEEGIESDFGLSRSELLALLMLLRRHESELDSRQLELFDRVTANLYQTMSVAEMEDVEGYYKTL